MKADKKAKRKAKLKERVKTRERQRLDAARNVKSDFLFDEAKWYAQSDQFDKAILLVERALRLAPDNIEMIRFLGYLGHASQRDEVELKALRHLWRLEALPDELYPPYVHLLIKTEQYNDALAVCEKGLARLVGKRFKGAAARRQFFQEIGAVCRLRSEAPLPVQPAQSAKAAKAAQPTAQHPSAVPPAAPPPPAALPAIPVSVCLDRAAFLAALTAGRFADPAAYDLCLQAHRLRFRESFESLICLAGLKNVRSLWYQEETARKVMRRFHGRALLADEVGLGKTIEAAIVLKEYLLRGMVKAALILVPAPLVSQWQEELRSKFDLAVPSTDDADFRPRGEAFWDARVVVASINIAKSRRHADIVCRREYDLVIVDEAHHLKNRSTQNWKLVNALKKRFLLLLTATPVENNLMELYNLITLLKPGQLSTPSEFKAEFMTRGDPTAPQNRARLRQLLDQVMIRNTRALAKVNLPPRYAHTVRIDPTAHERELYQRVTDLVRRINTDGGARRRVLLKNLLAEAGSSPPAVAKTVGAMLADPDLSADQYDAARAIVNLTRTMGDTRKNAVLFDLLRAMPGKTIIFVKYTATLEHVSDFLTGARIAHALFHGGLNNAEKDRQIDAFRQTHDVLVSTEVGGEGRNLQFCHQMINYDLPWNPMRIEQRIGRIHRIGQESEVLIQNLCAAESAEDYILEILDRKINMFEMVIGEIDMILGRIRGEAEFSELVYEIWVKSASKADQDRGFGQLAAQLARSKNAYLQSRSLDTQLFGENYEL